MVYVISGDKDPEIVGVDYFLEGIFRIRRRHIGPWKLRNLQGEYKDYKYRLSMESLNRANSPIPLTNAEWYSRGEVHRFFSSGQNFNPLPTSPEYKPRLDSLLAGYGSSVASELLRDLAALNQEVSDETERDILAKARIGQGRFRANLVRDWRKGETCALTGIDIPEMLIASHIKPWRDSSNLERLDSMNGLLLISHADSLFDRYLMSFHEVKGTFNVALHPRVRKGAFTVGLKEGMRLDTSQLGFSDEQRFAAYMADHFSRHRKLIEEDASTE